MYEIKVKESMKHQFPDRDPDAVIETIKKEIKKFTGKDISIREYDEILARNLQGLEKSISNSEEFNKYHKRMLEDPEFIKFTKESREYKEQVNPMSDPISGEKTKKADKKKRIEP